MAQRTKSARATRATKARDETGVHVQRFTITYEYPVHFTDGLLRPDNPTLAQALARLEPDRRHRCIVFVDDGIIAARPEIMGEITGYAAAHSSTIELVAPPIPVPGGEGIKNKLWFVEQMQGQLVEHRIDRHSYVIAIGGGAVLDAVGLVAATTHRGIRLIRVPTTVLAQDDSGVGVKNGVNLLGVKNLVGTLRAALCRAERHRSAGTAAGSRQDRRHGGGGEGRADPRQRSSSPGSSATPRTW